MKTMPDAEVKPSRRPEPDRARESRVTTVELDVDDVEYVRRLISEGRVRSLKEFVELCVKFGKNYTLDRWTTGVINVGPIRAVLILKKMVDLLIQRVATEELMDVGREMGEVAESYALLKGFETTDRAKWPEALRLLSDFGLGAFSLNDDRIEIHHAAYPAEINEGMLEQIFKIKISPIKTLLDVQFFRILEKAKKP